MMDNKEILEQNLQENTKKKNGLKKILFLFLFLLILFYLYIRYVEPSILVVHEYPVIDNHLPGSFDGTKIVHFSDILYGTTIEEKSLDKIVNKINELKGDIVVFTGDLFNDTIHLDEKNYAILKEKLKNITAAYRKYAIVGNMDMENLSIYKNIMETAGFIVLDNKNDLLYFNGSDPLMFIGTMPLSSDAIDVTTAMKTEEDTSNYYKIWLHHEPLFLDTLIANHIDTNLVLSGHSLHGLVTLPFDGYFLNQKGIGEYKKGYYERENIQMYVSSGVGTYKYSVRFLNPPSITLYRLYSHL